MDGFGASRFPALLAAAVLLAGCAARGPQTWRLSPLDRGLVLTPPGVASPAIEESRFTFKVSSWRAACAPAGDAIQVEKRGPRVRVTVRRAPLLKQPPGWLAEWTAAAEALGCLAPGTGTGFAMRILEAAPLDPSAALRLLHSDSVAKGYLDLGPDDRLQVRSPIMRSAAGLDTPIVQIGPTTGTDRSVQVTVEAPDTIGVETAWYTFEPRPDHNGARIVPVSAERNIGGAIEPAAAPLTNYFQFAPGAAFYRLFYKADVADNSITEIVIAAPTRSELNRRTEALRNDSSLCRQSDPEMCMVIPRRVAVNAFMTVTVNGAEVRLAIGSRLRSAVQAGGGPRDLREVLPRLTVSKPFGGKPAAVVFDRGRQEIFDLALMGGESISWK